MHCTFFIVSLFQVNHTLIISKMKTKRQLQQLGFLFITTSGGAISCSKLSKEMQTVFTTKAKSLQTVIKRANKYLELC